MANRTKTRREPSNRVTRKVGTGGVLANRACAFNNSEEVIVAGVGSLRVAGVPQNDAALADEVTVLREMVVLVQYSAATNIGEKLVIATADGQFGPAGATPDARTVVGRCEQQMAGAGLGWAYIQA